MVDEVGKMELFSERFGAALERNLASSASRRQVTLLTVAQKGAGLIAAVKAREQASTFTLSQVSRDMGATAVEHKLRSLFGAGSCLRLTGRSAKWRVMTSC